MPVMTHDTVAPAVAGDVAAATVVAVYQACVLSAVVEGEIPGHRRSPLNHSTHQRSASAERREYHRPETPAIINT